LHASIFSKCANISSALLSLKFYFGFFADFFTTLLAMIFPVIVIAKHITVISDKNH